MNKIGGIKMSEQIEKQTYIGIVKFTLQSMLDLSKEDNENIEALESTMRKLDMEFDSQL